MYLHVYTDRNTRKYIDTYMCRHLLAHAHADTDLETHTHACKNTHTHAQTHTPTHRLSLSHTHTHTNINTHTHQDTTTHSLCLSHYLRGGEKGVSPYSCCSSFSPFSFSSPGGSLGMCSTLSSFFSYCTRVCVNACV